MPENMSKEELRRAHRDTRQREAKRRRRIFYGLIGIVVLGLGVILSFTVFFNVGKIEVRGYSRYSNEDVLACCGVEKGDNLFLINKDKVSEHICEKLAYIGTVDVKVSLPNKLVITVYETSVKAAAQYSEGYVLLNEDGKVLAKVATLDSLKPAEGEEELDYCLLIGVSIKEAEIGKPVVFSKDKTFETYTQIMNLFIENDVTGITSLNLKDVYNIVMRYEDRIDVKVGSVTNIDKKMAFAAEVIKDQDGISPNEEGVIDATLEDKAYFSPTTTTTAPPTTEPTTDEETTKKGETTSSKDKATTTTTKKS